MSREQDKILKRAQELGKQQIKAAKSPKIKKPKRISYPGTSRYAFTHKFKFGFQVGDTRMGTIVIPNCNPKDPRETILTIQQCKDELDAFRQLNLLV